MGLDVGFKNSKIITPSKQTKPCRCGSLTHKTIRSSKSLLHTKNIGSKTNVSVNLDSKKISEDSNCNDSSVIVYVQNKISVCSIFIPRFKSS